MYHWEADQEDFLVLAGEALLIVEGEERPLRQWDFVHCPAGDEHDRGCGDGPSVVLAVGARDHQSGPGSGGYTVDEAALRHGAGVERRRPTPSRRTRVAPASSRLDTARAGFPTWVRAPFDRSGAARCRSFRPLEQAN